MGSDLGQQLTGTMEITFLQDIADQVYTSVEMASRFTSDAILGIGTALSANIAASSLFDLGPNPIPIPAAIENSLDQAMSSVINRFQRDSRRLTYVPGVLPAAPVAPYVKGLTVVATRQGDAGFNDNPPLLRGAFGTVPQTVVGTIPTPIRNGSIAAAAAVTAAALPNASGVNSIPANIEHLIVQALLGQNETPPLPATLAYKGDKVRPQA